MRASRGEFDCVLACYHDQGLIPVKLAAFGHAINVTLGLPFVRTFSCDFKGTSVLENKFSWFYNKYDPTVAR